ncbi:hypothetical protein Ahy_A09g043920 [Arachis hypogaea]|uniref:Uncharacterized protein n=1 Tax=Arachis hypogaea TaxID=3818 RepID=A0A445BJ88_ARAHY|nr:hypothetical protein Ahy_A09g043920 [Arachis hypogaea]
MRTRRKLRVSGIRTKTTNYIVPYSAPKNMDTRRKPSSMATECLDMFYGIDPTAFKMLTQVLHREVTQSLMVIAFLLSLESMGLSGIVEKSKKLESLGHALRTEATVSQVHGMRSILLMIIPNTLSNVCSRILGDVTMDAVWLNYQRNPARVLGCNTQDEGRSVAPELLSGRYTARRMHMQQGGRQTQ